MMTRMFVSNVGPSEEAVNRLSGNEKFRGLIRAMEKLTHKHTHTGRVHSGMRSFMVRLQQMEQLSQHNCLYKAKSPAACAHTNHKRVCTCTHTHTRTHRA